MSRICAFRCPLRHPHMVLSRISAASELDTGPDVLSAGIAKIKKAEKRAF